MLYFPLQIWDLIFMKLLKINVINVPEYRLLSNYFNELILNNRNIKYILFLAENRILYKTHTDQFIWLCSCSSRRSNISNKNRLEMIKFLVGIYRLTIDDLRTDDNIILLSSCEYGHLEIVKYLINTFDLKVEDTKGIDDHDALQISCATGHLEIIKFLVDTFKLTAKDIKSYNNSALRLSCTHGHLEVVKYLVDTFKLTAEDARSNSNFALHWAYRNNHLEVVKYLIDTFKLTTEIIKSIY
jgi:antitoxin component HigA of HigAB toxin-antitoxin module